MSQRCSITMLHLTSPGGPQTNNAVFCLQLHQDAYEHQLQHMFNSFKRQLCHKGQVQPALHIFHAFSIAIGISSLSVTKMNTCMPGLCQLGTGLLEGVVQRYTVLHWTHLYLGRHLCCGKVTVATIL